MSGGEGTTSVEIVEVGPRDGLQTAAVHRIPSERAEMIVRLAAAGIPRIEVASLVHPKVIPQMAGAEDLLAILRERGVLERRQTVLVANRTGYERAIGAGASDIRFVYTVSDHFNRLNAGMSAADGLRTGLDIVKDGVDRGMAVGVVLGTAFGCPYTGAVDPGLVAEAAARVSEHGASEVILADTVGVGVPGQVREFSTRTRGLRARVGFHFHNTRNTGYANALTAVEGGAEILDASIGGIGGCPFAPNATGNIATEDLVYALEREGVATGIDLDALIGVTSWLGESWGLSLPGMVHRVPAFPG